MEHSRECAYCLSLADCDAVVLEQCSCGADWVNCGQCGPPEAMQEVLIAGTTGREPPFTQFVVSGYHDGYDYISVTGKAIKEFGFLPTNWRYLDTDWMPQ